VIEGIFFVMKYYNERKYKHLLSKREELYIRDPKAFREYFGNDYTRQIQFRIRHKLEEALILLHEIVRNTYENTDKGREFDRRYPIDLNKPWRPIRLGLLPQYIEIITEKIGDRTQYYIHLC